MSLTRAFLKSDAFAKNLVIMQYARQPAASAAPKEQTPEQAQKYLESKGVAGTIQYLAALVLFHKPKDPEEFMIRKLKEMRTFKVYQTSAISDTFRFADRMLLFLPEKI